MKRKYFILIILILLLTGCKTKTYTVSFDTNGGSLLNSILIKRGDTIKDIEKPTKEGYIFVSCVWV